MSFGIIPLSPDDKPDSFVLLSMYEKLESENAKLRELLLRSYESFEEVYDRCDIDDSWRMETALEDMRVCMRELGVEVDG